MRCLLYFSSINVFNLSLWRRFDVLKDLQQTCATHPWVQLPSMSSAFRLYDVFAQSVKDGDSFLYVCTPSQGNSIL
jgi:hypothetical protein